MGSVHGFTVVGLPIVAALFYMVFAYLIPSIFNTSPLLKYMSDIPRVFAPWVAVGVLLVGLSSGLKRWASGRMLDRQKGADTISGLTWRQFEELLAAAYRRQGYRVVVTGGGGPDGGVDLILHGNGESVLVQCKQWRTYSVGVRLIREFHGILNSKGTSADRGIFVTFGEYTEDARRFAEENSIELVAHDRLLEMVMDAKRSSPATVPHDLSVADVQTPHVRDARSSAVPSCPKCGKPMVLRAARRGAAAGSQFWGCTGYPGCRGTVGYDS